MGKLALGLLVFFGVHSISMAALGWRNRMAARLGTRAWRAFYSVAAAIGLYLVIAGYGDARLSARLVYETPDWMRALALVLLLPAFTLALAAVLPGRIQARARHPLLLAAMLWAFAHLLTRASVADLLLFGSFLAWSIAVRISLEGRPARRPLALPPRSPNDAIALVGGLALYALFVLWLHERLIGVSPLV